MQTQEVRSSLLFWAFAQKRYVEKYGSDWPKGALERINAIK